MGVLSLRDRIFDSRVINLSETGEPKSRYIFCTPAGGGKSRNLAAFDQRGKKGGFSDGVQFRKR